METLAMLAVPTRLLIAACLGGLIGAERQWRGRNAGLRTNALVSLGASAFIVLSTLLPQSDKDPTRIAAQVVSGIGFLGAGVILRNGMNVIGLNTATTLWCSAAIGSLAGAGYLWQAAVATFCVVLVNIALRPIGRMLDRRPRFHTKDSGATYRLRVTCADAQEAHIRALLLQALGEGVMLRSLRSHDVDDCNHVAVTADLTIAAGRDDIRIEQAASRLSLEPAVTSVQWDAFQPEPFDEDR